MKLTLIIEDIPDQPSGTAWRREEKISDIELEPNGFSTERGDRVLKVAFEMLYRATHNALYRNYLKSMYQQAAGVALGFAAQQGDTRVIEALEHWNGEETSSE